MASASAARSCRNQVRRASSVAIGSPPDEALGTEAIESAGDREAFERLIRDLRPKLHRYCARMTGSVIDGEDVVQEALIKAVEAFSHDEAIARPRPWLFRTAHNEGIAFLRR